MASLSHRQKLFLDYLIEKLGFKNDQFLSDYLILVEKSLDKFKMYASQEKIWSDEKYSFVPKQEDKYKEYTEFDDYFLPKQFNLIDLLQIELKIKTQKKYIPSKSSSVYISATDIANFTYCPISYSIAKTFSIQKIESAIVGESYHKDQKLLTFVNYVNQSDFRYQGASEAIALNPGLSMFGLDDQNDLFFEEVSSSSLIYSGHADQEKEVKYFKSSKGDFVGQPDYIFRKNSDKSYFVVEEKFQGATSNLQKPQNGNGYEEGESVRLNKIRPMFYKNHINQLRSYLYGIDEYDLKYGYLIYWKYESTPHGQTKFLCHVLKVEKDDSSRRELVSVYLDLKKSISSGNGIFNTQTRRPAKCANCVVNLLCGHKTGQFQDYTIPYASKYMKSKYVPFPEELKKDKEDS